MWPLTNRQLPRGTSRRAGLLDRRPADGPVRAHVSTQSRDGPLVPNVGSRGVARTQKHAETDFLAQDSIFPSLPHHFPYVMHHFPH